MRKRKILAILVVIAALLAVGWFICSIPDDPWRAQRLPDGSSLRIVAMDYGRDHHYSTPKLKPWQKFLSKHLPSWAVTRLRLHDWNGSIASSSTEPNLAIVVVCEKSGSNSFGHAHAVLQVFDEQGNQHGEGHAGGTVRMPDREMVMWTINGPPTEKHLVLKFSEKDSAGKIREAAVFHVLSPVGGTNQAGVAY